MNLKKNVFVAVTIVLLTSALPTRSSGAEIVPTTQPVDKNVPSSIPANSQPNDFLEYVKTIHEQNQDFETSLEKQSDAYKTMLENLYEKFIQIIEIAAAILVFLISVCGTVFTYLNIRTHKDLKMSIATSIKSTADVEMKRQINELSASIREQFQQKLGTELGAIRVSFDQKLEAELGDLRLSFDKRMREEVTTWAVVAEALIALSNKPDLTKTPKPYFGLFEKIKRRLKDFPTHRSLGILLGRFYRHLYDDTATGLAVLQQVLKARRDAAISENADDAAILYNIACYRNNICDGKSSQMDAAAIQNERQEILQILRQSILLAPENRQPASTDPDLASLDKTTL